MLRGRTRGSTRSAPSWAGWALSTGITISRRAQLLAETDAGTALPTLEPPEGTGDAELADCELAELVTRFRHVRAQAVEFLDGLPPDDLGARADSTPYPGPSPLSVVVTHWVSHDAAALAMLGDLCGALHTN